MNSLPDRLEAQNTLLRGYAVRHQGSMGREHPDTQDASRGPFQRDRDRIIHATAFRRLKGKTQVFVTGDGDHYRTRLTHTVEVAQIARDIARAMGLNEDLCECIALAHDLGHPPFGHAGEDAIDGWMKGHGERFEHNLQSHRIVTLLETHAALWPGLNLNREVLSGMMKHVTKENLPEGAGHTLEAQVVNIADEIAYTSSDCDDGLREKLFSTQTIGSCRLPARALAMTAERGTSLRGALVNLLVDDLQRESQRSIDASGVRTLDDVLAMRVPLIGFSQEMRRDLDELRAFLWKHMYLHAVVASRIDQGKKTVSDLCALLHASPNGKIHDLMELTGSNVVIAVKDYVAGMTDWFAEQALRELRGPKESAQ